MKRMFVVAVLMVVCITWAIAAGLAASDQQQLIIHAAVAAKAKLTLGATDIHFPDADPDGAPLIEATEKTVSVAVKARTGSSSNVTLTVKANGDLQAGASGPTIPITKVTWTASGDPGFVGGRMDTVDTPAGSWTGSVQCSGAFSYFLDNDWSYQPGDYSQTVVYTLTAP